MLNYLLGNGQQPGYGDALWPKASGLNSSFYTQNFILFRAYQPKVKLSQSALSSVVQWRDRTLRCLTHISGLLLAVLLPGRKRLAHRTDGLITVSLQAPLRAAPSGSRTSLRPGGGLCCFPNFRCRTAAVDAPPLKVSPPTALSQKNLIRL